MEIFKIRETKIVNLKYERKNFKLNNFKKEKTNQPLLNNNKKKSLKKVQKQLKII